MEESTAGWLATASIAFLCWLLLAIGERPLQSDKTGERPRIPTPKAPSATLTSDVPPEELIKVLCDRLDSTKHYLSIALSANDQFQKFFDYHRGKIDRLTKRKSYLHQRLTEVKKENTALRDALDGQEEDHDEVWDAYEKAMDELDEFDVGFTETEKEKKSLEMSMGVYKEETGYHQEEMDLLKKQLALERRARIESAAHLDELEVESRSYNDTLLSVWKEKVELERMVTSLNKQLADGEEKSTAGEGRTQNIEGEEKSEDDGEASDEEDVFADALYHPDDSPPPAQVSWAAIGLGLELNNDEEEDSRGDTGNEKDQKDGFVLDW